METFSIEDISIDVERKRTKYIYLRIYPPDAYVRIVSPLRYDIETIRMCAIDDLKNIREIQKIMLDDHYFLGKKYVLKIVYAEERQHVEIENDNMVLYIHIGATQEQKQAILEEWYREQLKVIIPKYISKWEEPMNVKVSSFDIRKMSCRGLCWYKAGQIDINLILAKYPLEILEYVIVHEMAHLLVHSHSKKFWAIVDKFLPNWRQIVEQNRTRLTFSKPFTFKYIPKKNGTVVSYQFFSDRKNG
jgi:hypothetical protein